MNTVSPSTTSNIAINAVQVAPSGKYVYVGSDSTISVFGFDEETGKLTPVSGSPFAITPQ